MIVEIHSSVKNMHIKADTKTLAFYDENASAYSKRVPRCEDTEALSYFMEQMPRESTICDLGCGNGWASDVLLKNGYHVHAVDGSMGLAQEAKKLYGLDVIVQNFDELTFDRHLDGIWACWSLHHVSHLAFPNTLKHVSKFIRPGGLFFFSVKGGTNEDRDENDRLYARYTWTELMNIIEQYVDGVILKNRSWTLNDSDGSKSLRHQVFIKVV